MGNVKEHENHDYRGRGAHSPQYCLPVSPRRLSERMQVEGLTQARRLGTAREDHNGDTLPFHGHYGLYLATKTQLVLSSQH